MHKISQSAGKSFAYLLGVYLGDGCVTRSNGATVFRLNTIDGDFAQAVKAALNELTTAKVYLSAYAVAKSKNPNHSISCWATDLCAVFVEDTKSKQIIPAYVAEWPLSNKLAFIAGLMDSEGYIARNGNPTNRGYLMGFKCCDPWVPDFKRLMENVGIKTGKLQIEKPYKPGYKSPRRFYIKIQSWIDASAYFNIARKQERVVDFGAAGAYERRALHPRRLTSEAICQAPDNSGKDMVRTHGRP